MMCYLEQLKDMMRASAGSGLLVLGACLVPIGAQLTRHALPPPPPSRTRDASHVPTHTHVKII